MVKLLEQRGHKDNGLIGQFRQQAHAMESVSAEHGTDHIMLDVLTLRRHEKDYLLRGEKQYIDGVYAAISDIKKDVLDTDLISLAQGKEMAAKADTYLGLFDQLVAKDEQIASSIETFRMAVHTVEPLLESVYAVALAHKQVAHAEANKVMHQARWMSNE